jgi:hypothetical protein
MMGWMGHYELSPELTSTHCGDPGSLSMAVYFCDIEKIARRVS